MRKTLDECVWVGKRVVGWSSQVRAQARQGNIHEVADSAVAMLDFQLAVKQWKAPNESVQCVT